MAKISGEEGIDTSRRGIGEERVASPAHDRQRRDGSVRWPGGTHADAVAGSR